MRARERQGRGRPLDTKVHVDLLSATRDLLVEVGYDRLTIEAVAQRCRAGKAAIYRRWSGKPELVTAAIVAHLADLQVPDTGDLRGDLIEAGRACVGEDGRSQALVSIVLAAGRHDPHLQAMALDEWGRRVENLFRAVIERGVEQGAVVAGVNVQVVSEIVPVFAFHRAAMSGESMDDVLLVQIVDSVLLPALRR